MSIDVTCATERIGGRLGSRAARGGRWFDPLFWAIIGATVSWIIVVLRQWPCRGPVDGERPDTYTWMCYSDVASLFYARDLYTGDPIYDVLSLEYPVLIGAFITVARAITGLLGYEFGHDLSESQLSQTADGYFLVSSVLLFLCFLVVVWAHVVMGRDANGDTARSWDALLIALSPLVWLNGLINWDIFALMWCALGLLAWSREKTWLSGIFLGLAVATKFYPLVILLAFTAAGFRAGKYLSVAKAWIAAVATWLLVNFPVMLFAYHGWAEFWTMNSGRTADLGSIWYVLSLAGLNIPNVSLLSYFLMIVVGIIILAITLNAPRRPRIGQLALLFAIGFVALSTVYSPQFCLWLLPLVVLARPSAATMVGWTTTEVIYYIAIWNFLGGTIGPDTSMEWLYWFAVVIRLLGQLWVFLEVCDDMMRPWEDIIRRPLVDDPIGGILNHSHDAAWVSIVRSSFRLVPKRSDEDAAS